MAEIKNLKKRIARMEDILSSAACGDFDVDEMTIDTNNSDDLTALETGVALLVNDMGEEVRAAQKRNEELEEIKKKLQEAVDELQTPIIKIWDRVLVLPLIGAVDTRRSQKLTESLLTEIAGTQSKVAILDITGVPTVDSAVANHLLKTVASVKLLGAECVITGIRPEVAQTIVHLGVDLKEVETLSNLAEGLRWAFRKLGVKEAAREF